MPEEGIVVPETPMIFTHSETIGKIAEALAKAQGAFEKIAKDAENPFFSKPGGKKASYADIAMVIEGIRKALSDNSIAVIQSPQGDANRKLVIITTLLAHSSGEWFRGELALPIVKFDAQGTGTAISYARRYALQAFVCVAGEDDDGNKASGLKSMEQVEEEGKVYAAEFDQRTENQKLIKE